MEDEPPQLSTLLVARLTRLLDLNSLEEIKTLEECGYVKQNIDIEQDEEFDYSLIYEMQEPEKPTNQFASLLRSLSRKLDNQSNSHVVIPKSKLDVMVQLLDYLETDVSAEGLFRISGNKKRQVELKSAIRDGHNINFGVGGLTFNAHDVAGILKELLGELKAPLLTKQLYDSYQQVAGKFSDDSMLVQQQKLQTLQILFLLLPPLNRFLMKKLVKLLAIVAENKDNKMDAYNLAVVFAPNIICTRVVTGSAQFTENMEPFTDLLKFIIENSVQTFDIPKDFLKEAGITDSTTFCQRVDANSYRKDAQSNTNEAITLLYAQIQEMPDGKLKTEFLAKFQQSYPGTPVYVPNAVRKSVEFLASPLAPVLQPELSGAKLATPECSSTDQLLLSPKRKYGDTTPVARKRLPISSEVSSGVKRLRRSSQEIQNPTSPKKACDRVSVHEEGRNPSKQPTVSTSSSTPAILTTPAIIENSESRQSKVKTKLQEYKQSAIRTFRRSLSASSLMSKQKKICVLEDELLNPHETSQDDSCIMLHSEVRSTETVTKPSFSILPFSERAWSLDRLTPGRSGQKKKSSSTDCVNESGDTIVMGITNSAFNDDKENIVSSAITATSKSIPFIRKSLHPAPHLVPLKDAMKHTTTITAPATETFAIKKTPAIKRTLMSRGGPRVSKTLTLEKMQQVRERKLQENGIVKRPDSDILDDSLDSDPTCSTVPNLDKLSHISLRDSPRSDARELLTRKYPASKRATPKSSNVIESGEAPFSPLLTDAEISALCNTQVVTSV